MNKSRAFTLIELLVVIAIIAILAAILFPVFAQAKAAAKKTQALNGVKQIGLATLIYTGDNDGEFPAGSNGCWWQPIDGGWTYSVAPYIKSTPLLVSPGDTKSKATWPGWMTGVAEAINISYAGNGYMHESTYNSANRTYQGGGWGMYGVIGMDQAHDQRRGDGSCNSTGWMANGTMNETRITRPADTIMYAETYNGYPVWGPSNFFTGINWWDFVGFGGLIPDSRRDGTPYMVNGAVMSKNNRNGGVNVDWAGNSNFVFSDGHAKSMKPNQTNPDPTDVSKNLWDAVRPENP